MNESDQGQNNGRVAQLIKGLLHKREELLLDCQRSHKSWVWLRASEPWCALVVGKLAKRFSK